MRKTGVMVLVLFLAACGNNDGSNDAGKTDVRPESDVATELPDTRVAKDLPIADNSTPQADSDAKPSTVDSNGPDLDTTTEPDNQTKDSDPQIPEVDIEMPDLDIGCTPVCTDKECGSDGCGGECGLCVSPGTCQEDGTCHCEPQCDGIECGADGCLGSCGECGEGLVCSAERGPAALQPATV